MMDVNGHAKPLEKQKVRSLDRLRPTVAGRPVSLILSLIHVRVSGSITVYYRALSRIYRPSWSVLDCDPTS